VSADEHPLPEAYRDSEEGWWTRYGGHRDPVSGVLRFPKGALPCPADCQREHEHRREP
jgi:hypothetical protein